jgi:cellulose synthase/poly-beta-1,6-N-acetylglucosamine synthase-like glycosyltransferase
MQSPAPDPDFAISVILRTRDTTGTALEAISVLADQASMPAEFVVIDSGSAPAVLEQLKDLAAQGVPASAGPVPLRLLIIPSEEYQSARTLNRAIRQARGDLLAILSQDAVPTDRSYLTRLRRWFADRKVAGVYGRQIHRGPCSPLVEKDLIRTYPPRSRTQRAPDCWFANTCSMIRRDLWQAHPFSEQAWISEDHEWAKWFQARGYVVGYEAGATVFHHHQYDDLRAVWDRFRLEGRGLSYVHAQPLGLVRAATRCLREVVSDAVWLIRGRRGLRHWLPGVSQRIVKHAALFRGARDARSGGGEEPGRT